MGQALPDRRRRRSAPSCFACGAWGLGILTDALKAKICRKGVDILLALCYSIVKAREAGPILWQVERGEADEHNGNHCVTYACYCGY